MPDEENALANDLRSISILQNVQTVMSILV